MFLPTSKKEAEARGWDNLDIILFTGDAYIDHPAFGAAVIGRTLEAQGYRVAIVPQPNWRDDLRDFKKLGKPRLFFGVTSGSMDSMVNHYTANKRLRSSDAYTPDGRNDMRPDYASYVYAKILKKIYPDTPVVLGGIEASLRRATHYDYWEDKLRPSILHDTQADLLIYGMGERAVVEIAQKIQSGASLEDLHKTPQIAYLQAMISEKEIEESAIILHSFETACASKTKFAQNFAQLELASSKLQPARIYENVGKQTLVINPPYSMEKVEQIDAAYDLPYTRYPHPRYAGKKIAAYEMVKHSVNIHRGCFGGCSFCTIAMHQGKFVVSRSEASILKEVERVTQMNDFKGYLSDVGGPSANMYAMKGKDMRACAQCVRHSCMYPQLCKNLNTDVTPLQKLLKNVRNVKGIKKAFVGSGIRYDLFMNEEGFFSKSHQEYFQDTLQHHISGRFKVAPEHTSPTVLQAMRKPSYALFQKLKTYFDHYNRKQNLRLQLIPYFISSHPACTNEDMQRLAQITRQQGFKLEQVQDFTPTPMTLSSAMYYTGINPYTLQKIYVARSLAQKKQQNSYFFWYKK
ncbi:MAG: YgiQ family radical SAM protein [Bacteroidales bacterium]